MLLLCLSAIGLVTKKLNQKMTKTEDMNHWFMRDQQDKERFRCYRRERKFNNGDYLSKNHLRHAPPTHIRTRYLTPKELLHALRQKQGNPVLTF